MLLLFVVGLSYAEGVIEDSRCSALDTTDEHISYAYCDMKFDTENYNYSYNCKGVRISQLLIRDKNNLVVGRIYTGKNHPY